MDSTYAKAVEHLDFQETLSKEHSAVRQALGIHLRNMHDDAALLATTNAMLEAGITHVNDWLQERGESHINAMILAAELLANVVLSVTDDPEFIAQNGSNHAAFTLGTLTAVSELAYKSVQVQLKKQHKGNTNEHS